MSQQLTAFLTQAPVETALETALREQVTSEKREKSAARKRLGLDNKLERYVKKLQQPHLDANEIIQIKLRIAETEQMLDELDCESALPLAWGKTGWCGGGLRGI